MKDILILLKSIIFHKEKRLLISDFKYLKKIFWNAMPKYTRPEQVINRDSCGTFALCYSMFFNFLYDYTDISISEKDNCIVLAPKLKNKMYDICIPLQSKRKDKVIYLIYHNDYMTDSYLWDSIAIRIDITNDRFLVKILRYNDKIKDFAENGSIYLNYIRRNIPYILQLMNTAIISKPLKNGIDDITVITNGIEL